MKIAPWIFLALALSCQQQPAGPWKLDRAATMLDEGQSFQLNLKGTPPRKLEWTSGDEVVAQVNKRGEVLAVSAGDAWIFAANPKTGEKDSCLVSVGYLPQNPILPPSWELFIADGEPHVFDGRMYIFGSRDNYDGMGPDGRREWCSDNYHVLWSDDLLHWNDAGEALNLKDIPDEVKGGGIRLWAPDVFRDPQTGKYHMLTCTNNDKVFILDAEGPEGPYTHARTVTLNGEELGHIDPGILVDDDGKVYLALPKFMVAQLDPEDYSRILPETVRDMIPFMPKDNDPFEGPSLRKRGDTYYYIYIQNNGRIVDTGWIPTRMAYLTAKDPLGPYTYQGLIVTNHEYPNTGNVHGSFECWKGQWIVQYHRSVPGLALTRVACLDPLEFNGDGTIQEVKMSSSGVRGAFRPGDEIQASAAVEYSLGRDGGEMVELKRREYPVIHFKADGQWTGYRYVDFSGAPSSFTVSIKSGQPGGQLEVRTGSPDGPVIATLELPDTGWKWKQRTVHLQGNLSGKEEVFLVARQAPFRVKWFKFN
jgi:hypothetical protein